MKMIHFRYVSVAFVGLVLITAGVFAGGQQETPPEDSAPVERSTTTDDETRQEIQEILAGFGVQTFRGAISGVDFSLEQLNGESLSLTEQAGNFIFLNFWATWCPPCREEMPSMNTLYAEMEGLPFRMVAVNVREDRDTVEGFVEEFGYDFPIVLDKDGRVSTNYGVRGIPTTFFIAPDGTVLGMLVGTRYWDEAEVVAGMKRIAELVAAE